MKTLIVLLLYLGYFIIFVFPLLYLFSRFMCMLCVFVMTRFGKERMEFCERFSVDSPLRTLLKTDVVRNMSDKEFKLKYGLSLPALSAVIMYAIYLREAI